jgi:hypothetical protein
VHKLTGNCRVLLLTVFGIATVNGGNASVRTESQSPAVTLTIGDGNTIRLSPGATADRRPVLLVIGNADQTLQTETPAIEDHAIEGAAALTFGTPQQVQKGPTSGWLFDLAVTGLGPNASDAHLAAVSLGTQTFMRSFTVTNRPVGSSTWTVTPPGVPWIVTWEAQADPLTLTITTQDVPISGLAVVQSTLRDAQNTAAINKEDLEISTDTPDQGSVPAHATRAVTIRLRRTAMPHFGKFTGNIQLSATNMPDAPAVAVTLYSSSIWLRVLGAVAIAVGVLLAHDLLHRVRPRLLRATALRPVLLARDTAVTLRSKIQDFSTLSLTFPLLQRRLENVEERLATERLDAENLLPSAEDSPFGSSLDTAKLQTRLTETGIDLVVVATVVRVGIEPAVQDLKSGQYDGSKVKSALQHLDELGDAAKTESEALSGILPLLAAYRQPAGGRAKSQLADPMSVQEATYLITAATRTSWVIIEIGTVAVGIALLVLPNAGFAWLDVFYCLIWGLGIPATGAAFQALTPTSVAASLGVAVPRI